MSPVPRNRDLDAFLITFFSRQGGGYGAILPAIDVSCFYWSLNGGHGVSDPKDAGRLRADVDVLKALRQEDQTRAAEDREALEGQLADITARLNQIADAQQAQEAAQDLRSADMHARLDRLQSDIGEPSEAAKRRYTSIWDVLERPWYRQPAFIVGFSALPAMLVAASLAGKVNIPQPSFWAHKVLGTHAAVKTGFSDDPELRLGAMTMTIDETKRANSEFRSALDGWLTDSPTLRNAVASSVDTEIRKTFKTHYMGMMHLGLTNYDPTLFAGPEGISRTPVNEDQRAIPVPREGVVSIVVAIKARRFDLSHILAHTNPALGGRLGQRELQAATDKITSDAKFSLAELPSFSINGKRHEIRWIHPPIERYPSDAEPFFEVGRYQNFVLEKEVTAEFDEYLGASFIFVTVEPGAFDTGDLAWDILITVRRAES